MIKMLSQNLNRYENLWNFFDTINKKNSSTSCDLEARLCK